MKHSNYFLTSWIPMVTSTFLISAIFVKPLKQFAMSAVRSQM